MIDYMRIINFLLLIFIIIIITIKSVQYLQHNDESNHQRSL